MIKNDVSLFSEFDSIPNEEWLKQLRKDLKDIQLENQLEFYDSIEQIHFKSYFHWSEEIAKLSPAFTSKTNDWTIRQPVIASSPITANNCALKRLNEGASGIGLLFNKDLTRCLKDINYSYIYTDFSIANTAETPLVLAAMPKSKNLCFSYDPVLNNAIDEIEKQFLLCKTLDNVCSFEVNNTVYAQAGANCVQQLGILLSQINEYLAILTKKGYAIDDVLQKIQIKLGIGEQLVFETAKFRAARILIQNLAQAYQKTATGKIRIHAETLALNKSLRDPYTNLLRLSTEGMSAAIGGADIISILPYDFWAIEGPGDFAYRMSTNIAHILKEEAYFNQVTDAAHGAYAFEMATKILAEEAWTYFKKIEAEGGFLAAQKHIQNDVKKTRSMRIELTQTKTKKYIGINCFENPIPQNKKWDLNRFSSQIEPLILELHLI
jgi:methylmalonyl-CoA mutase